MVVQTGGIRVLRVAGPRAHELLLRLGSATAIPALGEACSGRLAELQVLTACVQRRGVPSAGRARICGASARMDTRDDDRSGMNCPHRPPCPGCPRFGEPGIARGPRSALDELARTHALPRVQLVSGQTAGFRHRARLAIRGRLGTPKLGLFELGTHRVVHIPNCSVHHPLINHVANVVRRALVDAQVTAIRTARTLALRGTCKWSWNAIRKPPRSSSSPTAIRRSPWPSA